MEPKKPHVTLSTLRIRNEILEHEHTRLKTDLAVANDLVAFQKQKIEGLIETLKIKDQSMQVLRAEIPELQTKVQHLQNLRMAQENLIENLEKQIANLEHWQKQIQKNWWYKLFN